MPRKQRFDKRRPDPVPPGTLDFLRTGAREGLDLTHYPLDHPVYQQIWRSISRTETREHVRRHPGTRPLSWWTWDAPQAEAVPDPPREEPIWLQRRMLKRGVGTPSALEYGVPTKVYNFDAPPYYVPSGLFVFESQAGYLRRSGLFLPGEEKRVPPEAYKPVELVANAYYGLLKPGVDPLNVYGPIPPELQWPAVDISARTSGEGVVKFH